ncbi:MAG: hypothetical protein E7617_01550 [Ruminococcaceae bacterium]|nr:hypothetical protein [Oscillospiraceae bacterium]
MMKRLISAITVLTLIISLLVSCKGGGEEKTPPSAPRDKWEYKYNPYDNRFKDPIDTGAAISVSGKQYIYSDIDIRDKDEIKNTTMEKEIKKIYNDIIVEFSSEDTVEIIDYTNTFPLPPTKGERIGNVLMLTATDKTGSYTYPIRIEIHTDYVYVIHNAHTHYQDGLYSTITFKEIVE